MSAFEVERTTSRQPAMSASDPKQTYSALKVVKAAENRTGWYEFVSAPIVSRHSL